MTDGPARLHGLDGLRGAMMLMVVLTHAATSYIGIMPDWPILDTPSIPISLIGYFATLFSMTVFLFLGGYFGRAQLDRKGTRAFAADRWLRIGLPLIVFWPIMRLAIYGLTAWGDVAVATAGRQIPAHPVNDQPAYLVQLWFLYVIGLCYLAALAFRALPPIGLGWLDRIIAVAFRWRIAALLWAAPLSVTIFITDRWNPWMGIPTPAFPPLPNIYAIIGYGTAFAAGWLVRRQPWILDLITRDWLLNMVLGVGSSLLNLYLLASVTDPGASLSLWLVVGLSYTIAAWGWTLGLIGTAMRWVRRPNRVATYVGSASYWVYLVHMPVVCIVQILLYPLAWPPELKFAIVCAVSLPLLFGSYNLFVSNSWIGQWLNGRKAGANPNRPADPTPADAASRA